MFRKFLVLIHVETKVSISSLVSRKDEADHEIETDSIINQKSAIAAIRGHPHTADNQPNSKYVVDTVRITLSGHIQVQK
jgi:hypothetical protein